MDKAERKVVARQGRALAHRLWQWDPLNISPPDDEYECIAWPLLRRLRDGEPPAEISRWLETHRIASDRYEVIEDGTILFFGGDTETKRFGPGDWAEGTANGTTRRHRHPNEPATRRTAITRCPRHESNMRRTV